MQSVDTRTNVTKGFMLLQMLLRLVLKLKPTTTLLIIVVLSTNAEDVM